MYGGKNEYTDFEILEMEHKLNYPQETKVIANYAPYSQKPRVNIASEKNLVDRLSRQFAEMSYIISEEPLDENQPVVLPLKMPYKRRECVNLVPDESTNDSSSMSIVLTDCESFDSNSCEDCSLSAQVYPESELKISGKKRTGRSQESGAATVEFSHGDDVLLSLMYFCNSAYKLQDGPAVDYFVETQVVSKSPYSLKLRMYVGNLEVEVKGDEIFHYVCHTVEEPELLLMSWEEMDALDDLSSIKFFAQLSELIEVQRSVSSYSA